MHRLSLGLSEQLHCVLSPFHFNNTIVGRLFLPIWPHKRLIVTQSIYVVSNVPNFCKLLHAICSTHPQLVNLSLWRSLS